MCGIFLELLSRGVSLSWRWEQVSGALADRGPDHLQTREVQIRDDGDKKVFLAGSVLWLQGRRLTPQPVLEKASQRGGGLLMWNGDVFGGDLIKDEDGGTLSDTEILFRALESSPSSSVPSVLCKVRGPFAFAYLRPGEGRLWFGRDVLGRHCLLAGGGDKEGFFLSSVAAPEWGENSCVEVPAMGVFEKDLATFKLVLHPWEGLDTDANIEDQGIPFSVAQDSLECPIALPAIEEALPPDKDRDEWIGTALREKWSIHDMVDRFWEEDAQSENHARSFLFSLQEAVRKRVRTRPDYCKDCVKKVLLGEDLKCGHCKVAVLFSGGLDSTVLAALADRAMEDCPEEQIDLINVAFQMEGGSFEVPDRITARQALEELRSSSSTGDSRFNLVEVDVTKSELVSCRRESVSALLHPTATTVLDDGIGCALWFAARGRGSGGYASPARVILLGTGADEQLGGYSRHRAKFAESGILGLTSELRMELGRIWRRNLGRDNRVVASHGVAPRYPFLDEEVVSLLSRLKAGVKAELRLPRGAGEKVLLRALAAKELGLPKTACEPKRAIQFGSRIAKMEDRKEKGHHRAKREKE